MLNSIFAGRADLVSLLVTMFTAIVLGVLTAMVFLYRSRHSASFALTLSLLPMTVAVIILLVNGNVGTGVAVAGAFALVRFRSIPGTAREIAAIFTAMAIGLALGMGYLGIAALFFLFSAALTLVLTLTDFGAVSRFQKRLKITIPENFDYNGLFDEVFEKFHVKAYLEKVRTTDMGTLFELTYEVTLPQKEAPKLFLDELRTRNGNLSIVLEDFTEKEVL